jgi:hypothetical protein
MTQFRATSIYIQQRTRRRLSWIIKAIESPMSPDEMGDAFINEVIERLYPQVIETEKDVNTAYQEAEERLQKALNGNKD